MKDKNPKSVVSCSRFPFGPTDVGGTLGDGAVADAVASGLAVPGGLPSGQASPGQASPGSNLPDTGLPDPGVPDHPVLDRSGAMRRLELDDESYGQLLALMTVEVSAMLDALTEAWRNGDAAAMRQHAHRLKSEAANVGAEEVRFAASRLEQLLRQREGADGDAPHSVTPHAVAGHVSSPNSAAPHMFGPGDASAAVSHLRTALARLAAVLGQ